MAYGKVREPALTVVPKDYYMEPFAKISDVKEVATYMTKPEQPSEYISPAEVPGYVHPKMGLRLEKEKGVKRPAEDDEGHLAYANRHADLGAAVQKVASSAASSVDVVADRESLKILLEYLSETLTPYIAQKFQKKAEYLPVDLVKITRGSGGKGVVLDLLYDWTNFKAGVRYRGRWKRSEASMHGIYSPAWERLATGDRTTRCIMITGLPQISGTRAGEFPKRYKLAELDIGGLKVLSRTRFHCHKDGKKIELHSKNWYERQEYNLLDTYEDLLLSGLDMHVMGLHRSGKLIEVLEVTVDTLVEKQPAVVAAAERRFGRLAKLLKQVTEIVKGASGDGPWVLQWQNGRLVLGAYQKEPVVDLVEEDKMELITE